VYKFYRDLINFQGRGDPARMLRCINPAEVRKGQQNQPLELRDAMVLRMGNGISPFKQWSTTGHQSPFCCFLLLHDFGGPYFHYNGLLVPEDTVLKSLDLCIDNFNSIFHHRNWRAKVSCDVDIDQLAGSMVM